ncbi:hypothetical protein G4B88_030573 [Cannabis sativa]|uniref:Uncharacterized protein n=1 Tax=Cannabis sativa TaxID=3483 RepID=A0A7J6DJC8_CANSA|nr:hypothetical protein G4B88_030573 [Cannabis sativa]
MTVVGTHCAPVPTKAEAILNFELRRRRKGGGGCLLGFLLGSEGFLGILCKDFPEFMKVDDFSIGGARSSSDLFRLRWTDQTHQALLAVEISH